MKNFIKLFIFFGGLVLLFGVPSRALAEQPWCFCYSAISDQSPLFLYKNPGLIANASCKQVDASVCNPKSQSSIFKSDSIGPSCVLVASSLIESVPQPILTTLNPPAGVYKQDLCNFYLKEWNDEKAVILANGANSSQNASTKTSGSNSILSTLIADCGKADWKSLPAQCKDVTVFVKLALDIVDYMFAIIGALALAVFVYGGFVLIFSTGSEEKVKEGKGAMVNAVIGILVAFSGYALVSFLGYILNLKAGFQLF